VCCVSRLVEACRLICRVRCTYSVPPTLVIVHVFLIPTYPRIGVCSIYSMVLVASCGMLKVIPKLCYSNSLAKMRFWRFLHLLQRRRVWVTVLRRSPHLQRGASDVRSLLINKESSRPIFSVRSCFGSALSRFLSSRGVAAPPWWVWTCVCRAVFFVIPSCANPLPLCLRLAPTSDCSSEWM
jgi:hypothetical protein